jgi:hypothetical protein
MMGGDDKYMMGAHTYAQGIFKFPTPSLNDGKDM